MTGFEKGDTVRVVREFKSYDGNDFMCLTGDDFDHSVGNVGVVVAISDKSIEIKTGSITFWHPILDPPTLEIVKKHDGAVPQAIAETITGDSTMKNGRFDIEIVKEKTDDKGKTTNGIVVKKYTKFHADAVAAKEYAKMKHGIAILEQQEAGFEVAILVHNFCG